MDDQRANVEFGAQLAHALGLFGVDFGRAPHARAGRENLKGVGADLARALDGVGRSARRSQMHADPLGHANSLKGEAVPGVKSNAEAWFSKSTFRGPTLPYWTEVSRRQISARDVYPGLPMPLNEQPFAQGPQRHIDAVDLGSVAKIGEAVTACLVVPRRRARSMGRTFWRNISLSRRTFAATLGESSTTAWPRLGLDGMGTGAHIVEIKLHREFQSLLGHVKGVGAINTLGVASGISGNLTG